MKKDPPKDSHLPRKIFHAVAGSIIPVAYYLRVVPDFWLIVTVSAVTSAWLVFDATRLSSPALNGFFQRHFWFLMKTKEARTLTGASYMLAGSVITLILFSQPVAVAVLLFISLGDPAAAIVGRAVGRVRIYKGRTLEGSLAMFAVCLPVGYFIAGVSWPAASLGALVAALAELYSGQIDDNLTVPILSGAAIMSIGWQ